MDCPLLHVDICENWRRGGEKCKFLPSCKYLHAGPQRHRDSTLPAFPSRPNSDLCLGRPVFHGAQPLVAPLAIADADDEDGVEEISSAPALESQLTAGFAQEFGYQDWGDSGVDCDTSESHASDQSSGEDEPLPRPAASRKRLAKISKPDVVSSGAERKYVPPAPVLKRPASERSGIQSAPSSDLDYPVRYSWLVTCQRCGNEIMKVFNHRIVSCGKFRYRALRGYWLPKLPKSENKGNKDNHELFGRGGRGDRSKGKSCQVRLPSPGRWDVRRAKDRKKERRILKGKLAKVQFKHHDESECNPEKEDMKFEAKVRLRRLVHLRGEDCGPDADADADEKKIDVIDEDDLPLTISCLPCAQESPSKGQKRKTQKRTAQRRQRRKTV